MLTKPVAVSRESDAIVFGSPVSVGHVRPLLPLARRLVERGFTVVWAISGDHDEPASRWRQPLSEIGVHFVDLDGTAPFERGRTDEFASMNLFPRLVGRANDVAAGAADAIRAALDGRRAARGVYDFFALWSYVAMRRLGIDDVVVVVSAFPTAIDAMPVAAFADDPVYQRELAQLRRSGFGAFDDVPRMGVIPRDPALRVICFTSPHLCPESPAGIQLLGVAREALPHVEQAASAPEEGRTLLVRQLQSARDCGNRIVLLSLGTVVTRMFAKMGPSHVAFLKRLYTTLAASALGCGAVVVASTCDSSAAELGIDEAALGAAARGRVFAMPFVPQPFLFAHGLVDVMLTHGGANTFHETVLAGIPLLISPGFGDQASVAQAAARLGVGVCVEAITYPGLEGAVPLERVASEVLPAMLAPGMSSWKLTAARLAELVGQERGLDAAEAALRI